MKTIACVSGIGNDVRDVSIWFAYPSFGELNTRSIRQNGISVPGPLWVSMYWGILTSSCRLPSVDEFRMRVPKVERFTPPAFMVPTNTGRLIKGYNWFCVPPERFMEGLIQAFPAGKRLIIGEDVIWSPQGEFVFEYHAAPILVC